jgi:hypothetical protein
VRKWQLCEFIVPATPKSMLAMLTPTHLGLRLHSKEPIFLSNTPSSLFRWPGTCFTSRLARAPPPQRNILLIRSSENVASMLALIGLFSSVGQVRFQFLEELSSSFRCLGVRVLKTAQFQALPFEALLIQNSCLGYWTSHQCGNLHKYVSFSTRPCIAR